MLLRLFRLAVAIGLLAWAAECLNLSNALSRSADTEFSDWRHALGR
jgi:hypothetical protein